MAEEVGVGYLSIVPSMRGFGAALSRQAEGPLNQFVRDAQGRLRDLHGRYVSESALMGQESGEQAGQGFTASLKEHLGKAGFLAVGAAVGAALVVGVTEAIDQANIKNRLQAQLGTTGPVAAEHGKVAGKLFSSGVSETFQDAADAIKGVVRAGLVPPDATNAQLESIATKVTDVASIMDEDLGATARAVGKMMKTGLVDDASEALDILTRGVQTGANEAEDLLDTFSEYSTQFRNMGLSGEQAMGLISQGLQAGARDADVVADTIKEFSIEAVAGGDRVKDGFKSLGLNADQMVSAFAKGGPGAAKAFDLVLDKLRGIEDPAKRNAVAIELFGTKAEDMGDALFALDPSKAVDTLGKVEGAADRAGETLRSGPQHAITVFTRTLKQNFVNFLGTEVLPVISRFGHFLNSEVRPPLQTVGSAIASVLVPTLRTLWNIGKSVVGFLREWGIWLAPLAILIGGLTLALNAQAIATGFTIGVMQAYALLVRGVMAVTRAWAAVQALFNSIMALNPITLVVIALVALGAALVIAYKRSETFRNIVQAAWNGIKTAALFVWNSVLRPALQGIWTALQAVGKAALWLWNSAIKPAFQFIWTAAKYLFAIVATIVLIPLILIFKLVAATAKWLWNNAIKPAFNGIATVVGWAWRTVVKPVINAWIAIFKLVARTALWLWNNAIKPAFNFIRNLIVVWWAVVRGIFIQVTNVLRNTLGTAFRWLYNNVIKPVWTGIKSVISTVWNKAIKPIFGALKAGVNAVRDGFKKGVDAIGRIWNGLKSVARKPVQFVIDTVYNNGIRKVWNLVAGLVGLKKLSYFKFATGGRVWGPGTETSDSIPALLSRNEHVWTAKEVRAAGGHAVVEALRAQALRGGFTFAKGGPVGIPRFAKGGIVDWISGAAKKVGGAVMSAVDFLANPGKMWDKATAFIKDKLRTLGSHPWAQAMAGIPRKILSALKEQILGAVEAVSVGPVGGAGVKRWSGVVLQALRLVGQPSSLLNTTLRRMAQESGGNPRAVNRWDINWQLGHPSVGLMQVIGPTFQRYAGPFRDRGPFLYGVSIDPLANIYASMRYALARYGSLSRAYNRPGGYAAGGRVRAGQWAMVGERGPELVRFGGPGMVYPAQLSARLSTAVDQLAAAPAPAPVAPAVGAAAGGVTYVIQPRTLDMTVRDLEVLQRRQEARARVGRPR